MIDINYEIPTIKIVVVLIHYNPKPIPLPAS